MAFVQVHVSGLPLDAEDDEVSAELQQVLSRGAPAAGADDTSDALILDAVVESTENADDASAEVSAECSSSSPQAEESSTVHAAPVEAVVESSAAEIAAAGAPEIEEPVAEDDAEIAAALARAGQDEAFVSCVVVRDKNTFVCKGYCFVTFATIEIAQAAIDILNSPDTTVLGSQLRAQLSMQKERHAKSKGEEELSDLRIRRQRYAAVGKKAQYGHFNPLYGQKKCGNGELDGGPVQRNDRGRKNEVAGTRGGHGGTKTEADLCKRSTGFKA